MLDNFYHKYSISKLFFTLNKKNNKSIQLKRQLH